TWHRAGVQNRRLAEPPGPALANHLALTVRCPDDGDGDPDRPDDPGTWLVDAGLGDALHEPLPLRSGVYRQGPLTFRLRPSEVAPGGWRLDHDARGSFIGMDFEPAPATVDHFLERDEYLSTSPESGFVRVLVVQRRDAGGVDQLRGCTLSRVDAAEHPHERTIETEADWYAALADVFGLPLPELDAAERTRLWAKVHADHEAWVTAGRP
ncbi:MAG TPA: arylamine N-acetyltransferase, partial [Acidimicrobiales bacterium]